ncbi:MAG TPA: VCBS repeat-containing protein [Planctomycetota bacterium]|nr:VCBS repeat-containing protein [Planctomycetota bacterium]
MRARLALAPVLAALAAPLTGQIVFETPAVVDGGQYPVRMLPGDIDEDGFVDLITGHFAFGGPATVTFGTGPGTFGSAQPFAALTIDDRPSRLVDLDQDGHLDLLAFIGQSRVSSVSVLRGHGDGSFDPPIGINGAFEGPIDTDVGDFDADGNLDVAIYNGAFGFWAGSVLAVFGHGDGTFGEPVSINPSNFPFGASGVLRVGDTNGDGFDDVVLTTGVGMPTMRSNGDGSFTQVTCQSGCGSTIDKDFELADMNGDGRADLVSCTRILLANPDGSFEVFGFTLGFESVPRTVAVADLDADGKLDVLVGRNVNPNEFDPSAPVGDVRIHRGNGDGTAQLPALIVSHVPQPRDLVIADVDLDGRPDAVVGELQSAPSSARVLFNRTYGPGSPFLDLGGALAGSNGYPIQLATGTLVAGQPFAFRLQSGPVGGSAFHIVGLSRIDLPFKGGVMIPALDLINGPFPLTAAGALTLAGNWPAGGSGLTLYVQFWMPNGGGPAGPVSSSGLRAQIP